MTDDGAGPDDAAPPADHAPDPAAAGGGPHPAVDAAAGRQSGGEGTPDPSGGESGDVADDSGADDPGAALRGADAAGARRRDGGWAIVPGHGGGPVRVDAVRRGADGTYRLLRDGRRVAALRPAAVAPPVRGLLGWLAAGE